MKRTFVKYPQSYIQAAAIGTPEFDNMMKKYYPNIKDVTKYIQLDPTYREGSNQMGTYGRWILNLANRGPIVNEGHLTDVLRRFEDEKKHLINKDIMKFKSVDDVENMLNDEDSYIEKSHRQEVRERQKARRDANIADEADKVYEDSEWVVYVPKTYAAACKLGESTTWCTASTEDDYYYKYYTKQGPLYAVINKNNPKEKYQFHFESEQFTDRDDELIDVNTFLNDYTSLRDFFMNINPAQIIDISDTENSVYEYTGDYIPNAVRPHIKHAVVSGVDSIDRNAFRECRNLETLQILDTVVEIGAEAFYDCVSLVHIEFPDCLQLIDQGAFAYCHRLTDVVFPSGLEYIGGHAFIECESLEQIIIPGSVQHISWDAFSRCRELKYVRIEEGVVSIDSAAFEGCTKLERIDIPMSVRSMNSGIFKGCRNVVIYSDNPIAIEYADEYDRKFVTNDESLLVTL